MTQPAIFKQSDLTRAMKAAQASGYQSARIIIDQRGRMEIVLGSKPPREQDNEDDFDL